jgi:predicted AlkP superfamily pyrophosphatase or phosphodiesterase
MSIRRIVVLLLVAPVVSTGALLFLTGADYPPASARPVEVESPAEFRPPAGVPARSPSSRTVVVMVFDGLAPALLEGKETPALDRLRREGSWSHHMVPPFPSISLISGFTISTGCWPERHGIVTNRFFDPERGFYDHSRDADWLTGCENLHEAAERQGVPSAALGWYGAVSSKRGKLARIVDRDLHWADFPTDDERAQQVVDLLRRPSAERPQLILAYLRGPDGAAHFQGMESEEVRQAVATTDRAVATVMAAIEAEGLQDEAALIVTTDHGMMPVHHIVNVEYILRQEGIAARLAATGTAAFLYLDDPASAGEVAEMLSRYEHFDVLFTDRQPAWSRLGRGPRAGDLILSAKPGYAIEDRGQLPWFYRWLAWSGPELIDTSRSLKASHGYPPDVEGVHGTFYAWGAGIRSGQELARIDAVDIHPTVTRLLGIEPWRPVDGKVMVEILS